MSKNKTKKPSGNVIAVNRKARHDYFIEDIIFNEIEEGEIVPGLNVFHSPGHTLGTLSVEIETKSGSAIITGFCCNKENFPANGPAVCPGVHLNARDAWDSIQRVKESGALILPMHDLGLTNIK